MLFCDVNQIIQVAFFLNFNCLHLGAFYVCFHHTDINFHHLKYLYDVISHIVVYFFKTDSRKIVWKPRHVPTRHVPTRHHMQDMCPISMFEVYYIQIRLRPQ